MKTHRFAASLLLVLLFGAASNVRADESEDYIEDVFGMNLTSNTLAGFTFEGIALGSSVADLQKKLPDASQVIDKVDEKAGLDCYSVDDLKSADSARFYFYRGALYQIEVTYDRPEIEARGGAEAMLRKLVTLFGPPGHADSQRRTWQQPNCNRRADFYATRLAAQLIVSDTSIGSVLEQRTRREESAETVDMGF